MTLHVSALLRGSAYQVSDRWVTRGTRVWEPEANKTIVLRTTEALVSIGFSGRAYVASRPIDEWAAEMLWGEELGAEELLVARLGRDNTHGLSGAIRRLERALNRLFSASVPTPTTARVHIVVVGWRIRCRRLRPCLLTISNLDTGRLVTVRSKMAVRERYGAVMVDPPGWVPVGRLRELNRALAVEMSEEAREDLMIEVLRELSGAGLPIGPDAMCVRIPRLTPKPTIRFAPKSLPHRVFYKVDDGLRDTVPVVYTPIIVTPRAVQLPGIATGAPFDHLAGFEVEWRMPTPTVPLLGGVPTWLTDRQPRT